jgi:putative transposase
VVGVTHLHAHTIRPTSDNPDLPTRRHSVSLLHAHLVFVTKYRRPVFTDTMPTFCDHTLRAVCAQLDVELVQFNGEPDHVHLLVAYPPTLAISVLVQRLKGRTAYAMRREFTGARVRARMRGHLWSPPYFAVSCRGAPLSIIKQYIDGQPRPL